MHELKETTPQWTDTECHADASENSEKLHRAPRAPTYAHGAPSDVISIGIDGRSNSKQPARRQQTAHSSSSTSIVGRLARGRRAPPTFARAADAQLARAPTAGRARGRLTEKARRRHLKAGDSDAAGPSRRRSGTTGRRDSWPTIEALMQTRARLITTQHIGRIDRGAMTGRWLARGVGVAEHNGLRRRRAVLQAVMMTDGGLQAPGVYLARRVAVRLRYRQRRNTLTVMMMADDILKTRGAIRRRRQQSRSSGSHGGILTMMIEDVMMTMIGRLLATQSTAHSGLGAWTGPWDAGSVGCMLTRRGVQMTIR